MPVLYQHEVVRKPGKFSEPEIKKLAFLSHNKNQYSDQLKKWCELAKTNHSSMLINMQEFLKSDKAITSIEQFPKDLQPCLLYGLNHIDDFSTKEFLSVINFRNLKNEIKTDENGGVTPTSKIAELLNRCADTTLAIHKTGNFINKSFDEKRVFKLLNLLKDAFVVGKKNFKLNVTSYLDRPYLLNVACINEIDPCSQKIIDPNNNDDEDDGIENQEGKEDCPCKELKDKEHDCNCEDTAIDPCDCKCDDTCHNQNPCCATIETFVADLFVVKDEVSCYKPGEISMIENIMKGEERVKKHRHLQREEIYNEVEEENNTYTERDTQIDERFSLHKEIDKVVETDLSVDAGANYSSRAGNKKTYKSFSASLDVSFKQSRKDAKKIVQDESKNVISRAIEKVEKKVRTLTTKRMLNEIEEKNKHTFDGRSFTEHDNGIYFFVNQERKAQVYNYGVRTMLDLYVPDPSLRLKSLLEKEFELKKPEKPCLIIEDINPEDYLKYVQCYGFTDLEAPPKPKPDIIKSFNVSKSEQGGWRKDWDASTQINIPPGYRASSMKIDSRNHPAAGSNRYVRFNFGNQSWIDYSGSGPDDKNWKTINVTSSGTVDIDVHNINEFDATLVVKFVEHPPVDYTPWRLDVFNRIMEKYNKELEAYNQAFEKFQRNKQNKFNQNPFMLSETIKEQLKHSALEYITCQFFDAKNGIRHKVKPCGLPQMDIPETEEFGKKVRFFEHAIEWKFMSYMLYPYFWADKCTWEDKLQEEAQNGLFQKFLQSGYARVSVSIRPNYESMVHYFLSTGHIWNGAGIPPLSGVNYLPIHQEIKESKNNFNADRNGYLFWDSTFTPTLNKDEIIVKGDGRDDYLDTDPLSPTYNQLDSSKVGVDLNRVVVINCIEYRIVDILLVNGEVILKLDRDLEHKDPTICPNDFDDRYKDKNILWSTGAKFEGAPWSFIVPTSLTWLKEEECLPCYPINCKENC